MPPGRRPAARAADSDPVTGPAAERSQLEIARRMTVLARRDISSMELNERRTMLGADRRIRHRRGRLIVADCPRPIRPLLDSPPTADLLEIRSPGGEASGQRAADADDHPIWRRSATPTPVSLGSGR